MKVQLKSRGMLALVAIVIGWSLTGETSIGQEAARLTAKSLAEKLLIEGWERTPAVRNDSQRWFESAPADIQSHPDVQWAYALNRLHHRKFRDAKPSVDALARLQTTNWDIAYAQIWLSVFVDEFEQSLTLMRQLKKSLDAAAEVDNAKVGELYSRLGRLYGYLQGPYANRVQVQSLEETWTALQQGTPEPALRAFAAECETVIAQYEQLMAARQQKQDTEKETLVRKQQTELAQQTALVQQVEQQSNQARASREQVISDGQAEVSRLKQQLDAITAEWNRQQSAMATLRFELDGLWLSIVQIDEALRNERDPVIRQRLLLDRAYLVSRIRDQEIYLNSLQAAASGTQSQLGSASANLDQAVMTLQSRVGEIDHQIVSAEQTRQRANRKIRSLQADPKVSPTLVATIDAEAQALSSYDPFPSDVFKQRLLEKLQAGP